MSVEIATLMYRVDATEAEHGIEVLKQMEEQGARTEKAVGNLKGATDSSASSQRAASKAHAEAAGLLEKLVGLNTVYGGSQAQVAKATQGLVSAQSIEATLLPRNAKLQADLAAANDKLARSAEAGARAYRNLMAGYDATAAVQAKLANSTATLNSLLAKGQITAVQHAAGLRAATEAATAGAAGITKYGAAAKLSGNQLTNLSYQLNDVLTGLASGQKPFQIFAQQFGQIFQALQQGSGGVGGSLKALGALLGPEVALIGAVVVALGSLGAAFLKGRKDSADFANAIAITGNYAQVTGLQFEGMVAKVAGDTGGGFGKARAALLGLVQSGEFTGKTIENLGYDIIKLSQFTGESATKVAASFEGMRDHVADFAEKFNAHYHLLTFAQLEHIRLLEEQGKVTEAQLSFSIDLHKRLGEIGPVNLGYLEQAWLGVGKAISWTWEQLKGFGNQSLARQNQIAGLNSDIALAEQARAKSPAIYASNTMEGQRLAGLVAQRDALVKLSAAETNATQTTQAASDAAVRMRTTWASAGDDVGRAQREVAKYRADIEAIRKADPNSGLIPSATKQKDAEADIVKKYTPDATAATNKAKSAAESAAKAAQTLADNLAREAKATDATTAANLDLARAYGVSGAAAFEAQARAEGVGKAIKSKADVDDYVARQANLNASKEAVTAAKATYELGAKTDAQNRATDAVVAGTMSAAEASSWAQRELTLMPLIAAAKNASAEAQDLLNRKIAEYTLEMIAATAAEQRQADVADRKARENRLDIINAELKLIGATNREREVAIARIEMQQNLEAQAVGKSKTPEGQANIDAAGDEAAAAARLAAGQDLYNRALTHTVELLDQIDSIARDSASALADAFGKSGQAIGGVLTALTGLDSTIARIAADKKARELIPLDVLADQKASLEDRKRATAELAHIETVSATATAHAQVAAYGDAASAAKTFFKQGSAGYGALEAAEKAFRLVEFAMSAKSIAVKAFETAAKLPLFGAQATAAAGVGAANMFATLGPLGFAAVAAMAAVLVGYGVSSGGGAVAGANDAKDRQAAQGTGSVLGESAAKSDSISRALDTLAKNSYSDLSYSNSMVRSLQSIDSQIGVVAAALAKSLSATGALSTDSLNLGSSTKGPGLLTNLLSPISLLLPGLFGSKTTRTLQDQGLDFKSQSLSGILSGGIQGQSYAQVLENTKKSFLGLTYSNTNKTSTTTGALDPDFAKQVTQLIASLRGTVLEGAKALGADGAEAALATFQVDLGKLSFKDLKGPEIQDALNAIFGKLGDDLAATAIPALTDLQHVGEGAFETLARVVHDYQQLDLSLQSIGKTFSLVGVSSLAARERLIDLAGGLDNLVDQTKAFSDSFLSADQQIKPVIAAVTAEMARLGLTGIKTKTQFADLVLGLDVSTEAGAQLYTALLAVAPAFAKAQDYLAGLAGAANDNASLSDRIATARSALTDAYQRESSAIKDTKDRFQAFADTLKKFRSDLDTGPAAQLSPENAYRAAKAQFETTSASALGGDQTAIGDLQSVSQAYLDASKSYYASSQSYFDDLAAVKVAVSATEGYAQAQVSSADAQLAALDEQVKGLVTVNDSVLSVRDAVLSLQGLLGQAKALTGGGTGAASFDAAGYLADNPDILAAFAAYSAGSNPYGFDAGLSQDAFAQQHYDRAGASEIAAGTRHFATGGDGIVGGSGGTDSKVISAVVTPGELVSVRTPQQRDTGVLEARVADLSRQVERLTQELAKQSEAAIRQRAAIHGETKESLAEIANETDRVRKAIAA
jgi:phage-related minor tail protein